MIKLRVVLLTAVLYPIFGSAASLPTALQPLQPNLPASLEPASLADKRQLSAIAQPAFHSVTGTLSGAKPGAPATCYGQPCSPSACYPSALVTARHYVNYVNVTAAVQLSRAYNVSSPKPLYPAGYSLCCSGCALLNSI